MASKSAVFVNFFGTKFVDPLRLFKNKLATGEMKPFENTDRIQIKDKENEK